MSKGFQAIGAVVLDHAKVGLDLDFGGATLRYAKSPGDPFPERLHATLFAYLIQVGGNVWLNHRFVSYGAVDLGGARIGGNLHFDSGRFINPDNVAIAIPGASVDGVVYLAGWGKDGDVEVTGVANFSFDRVTNNFIVDHAKFLGAPGDNHGFVGTSMTVARSFTWRNVTLQNGARLDLRDARVEALLDDEQSWPAPGKLIIDGFTYNGLESEAGNRVDGPAQTHRTIATRSTVGSDGWRSSRPAFIRNLTTSWRSTIRASATMRPQRRYWSLRKTIAIRGWGCWDGCRATFSGQPSVTATGRCWPSIGRYWLF